MRSPQAWEKKQKKKHISRDTVQRWGEKKQKLQHQHHLSNFWQRMHIKRGERKKKKNKNQYIDWWKCYRGVCFLERPTFKDGHSSFTVQKRLEHFPFTVKHYLAFKHQYAIYSPILLGQKHFPLRELFLQMELLLCDCRKMARKTPETTLPEHIWAAGCSHSFRADS